MKPIKSLNQIGLPTVSSRINTTFPKYRSFKYFKDDLIQLFTEITSTNSLSFIFLVEALGIKLMNFQIKP